MRITINNQKNEIAPYDLKHRIIINIDIEVGSEEELKAIGEHLHNFDPFHLTPSKEHVNLVGEVIEKPSKKESFSYYGSYGDLPDLVALSKKPSNPNTSIISTKQIEIKTIQQEISGVIETLEIE